LISTYQLHSAIENGLGFFREWHSEAAVGRKKAALRRLAVVLT
jgi:hypothetical protein